MKRFMMSFAAILMIVGSLTACTQNQRVAGGTVGGAVVGGVAGSALTGGSTAGTIVGAVGGGFVGNRLSQ